MSEIVLSNPPNHYDYSSMVNINPELVNKHNNNNNNDNENNASAIENNNPPSQYSTNAYPAYNFPMGFTPVNTNYPHSTMSRMDYFNDPTTTTTRQPNSPESVSSSSSPTPSTSSIGQVIAPTMDTELIVSQSKFNNPTTARVKEMITRATSVPMEFYHTEFLEYSKECYEKKTGSKRSKRKRTDQNDSQLNFKRKKQEELSEDDMDELEEKSDIRPSNDMSDAEVRRQIHIQSEQKRRAQIKDGFDELRKHLPGCNNKKMSKAALLTRTVQQLQHLKSMQNELLSEVERLLQENESLKKFQHSVLQRQAMEKMYTF